MSIVQRALRSMRNSSRHVRGVEVEYFHATTASTVSLVAVPGRTLSEIDDENSLHREDQFADFLIEMGDLESEPVRGDYLTYDGLKFQVTYFGGGKLFDWHDLSRDSVRVHCVQVMADALVAPGDPGASSGYRNASGDSYATPGGNVYGPPK